MFKRLSDEMKVMVHIESEEDYEVIDETDYQRTTQR